MFPIYHVSWYVPIWFLFINTSPYLFWKFIFFLTTYLVVAEYPCIEFLINKVLHEYEFNYFFSVKEYLYIFLNVQINCKFKLNLQQNKNIFLAELDVF